MTAFGSLKIPVSDLEAETLGFGDWTPDDLGLNTGDTNEALNVIPLDTGYAPFRASAPISGLTLPSTCMGAVCLVTPGDAAKVYAGTTGGLYTRAGGVMKAVWTNLNQPFSVYNQWRFVLFGKFAVALHPQQFPLSALLDGDGTFSLLGGSPPAAACGARVGNFLVLGNLNEQNKDGSQPQRIRWSAFNNISSPWVSDPNTQADFQDMPTDGGAVLGITGRETGTVFQESTISRMTYVGIPSVFNIETIEQNRGALAGGGIIDVGPLVFFLSENGFFVWNGVNAAPIGNQKVDRYLFSRLNYDARSCIIGAHDAKNKCVHWAIPTGSSTTPTEILTFYYGASTSWYNLAGKWAHSILNVDYIMSTFTLGASLDDLTGNLDTQYPISFDDPFYKRKGEVLGGFDSSHTFGYFNGLTLAASLETSDAEAPNGARIFVNSSRPVIDVTANTTVVSVGARDQLLGGPTVYGDPVNQEHTGECPVLAEGRFLRFRATTRAGESWTTAVGIEIWRKAVGRG